MGLQGQLGLLVHTPAPPCHQHPHPYLEPLWPQGLGEGGRGTACAGVNTAFAQLQVEHTLWLLEPVGWQQGSE